MDVFPDLPDFAAILERILRGARTLAEITVREYEDEAVSDARDFLGESEDNLKRWTELLAEGRLSTEDFEWLVRSQVDLAKMHALRQTGLAMIRVDLFKQSLLNLVTDTIFDAVL